MREETKMSMERSSSDITTPKEKTVIQVLHSNFEKGLPKLKGIFQDEGLARAYIQNVIHVVNNNNSLKKCSPSSIINAAMVPAFCNLSVDPNLGQCALIPYGDKCTFQIMKNGLIQLALRTGMIHKLICKPYYKGELISYDKFEEEYTWGEKTSDELDGYFAVMILKNGFQKRIHMTLDEIIEHGKRYSQAYRQGKKCLWNDPEQKHFMYEKTLLKRILKWGPLSTENKELAAALKFDQGSPKTIDVEYTEVDYPDGMDRLDLVEIDIKNEITKIESENVI